MIQLCLRFIIEAHHQGCKRDPAFYRIFRSPKLIQISYKYILYSPPLSLFLLSFQYDVMREIMSKYNEAYMYN